jgi:uncharacterized protein YfaP (DUF2135 family)
MLRARYENAGGRVATVWVGRVQQVVELDAASGEIRENITLLEGENQIAIEVGGARQSVQVTLPSSQGITIETPARDARIGTRATELTGSYQGAGCPAGVIAVNGFMQQFAVATGGSGRFAEKVVLRPGANHLAVQIGERYKTRLVSGTFAPAKLLVTLVWDTNNTDLDLYVAEPSGETVWYGNKNLPSGGNLDVDRMEGFGPENYSLGQAEGKVAAGTYRVSVHYYASRGVGRSEWTVRVISDESSPAQQRQEFYGILDGSDSGNARPGSWGDDWNAVCEMDVARNGRVTFTPSTPSGR